MENRLLLDKNVNLEKGYVILEGKKYELKGYKFSNIYNPL